MEIVPYIVHHLVKGEDLNHHGTLYAGRSAEWFVESGFIAVAGLVRPENVVCLKIHGMVFTCPVHLGEIVRFESKVVFTGRTRLVAHVSAAVGGREMASGFITFVNVDKEGRSAPHGIVMEAGTPEDRALQERARAL